ncbi:MAG: magnesium chelatase subunit H, partial [Pseudomonadota bacterium]
RLPSPTRYGHIASDWASDPESLKRCHDDIASANVIIATMLFMEDHVRAVLPQIEARRPHCDAVAGCVSAGEIIKLTKLGKFSMNAKQSGPIALLKRLRGKSKSAKKGAGAGQMAMLRQIPRILRFIPGTAQDVRAYFITLQYWLAGSDGNLANLVRFLVDRYADEDRASLRGTLKVAPPIAYPDVGLYHPRAARPIAERLAELPNSADTVRGTVGVLLMRSYVLSGDTAHYDAVITEFERRGLRVIPAFASGLDSRPAIEAFFKTGAETNVDAVVSLTGFSLVGGPAYNDAAAAAEALADLDVPYLAAHALEFQTLEDWSNSARGLMPVEATIMVAIPEIDGATVPTVFGGRMRSTAGAATGIGEMRADAGQVMRLADRVSKLVRLRATAKADRKVAVTLFNFPPNGGATGTAAFLSVFQSLLHTLRRLKAEGYTVDVPDDADALRRSLLEGNAATYGADANVHTRIAVDDHVARETHLAEIETQWGPAPGRHQSDGSGIQVLGRQFGNVFVGVQPSFGYEGDPMRLLFEGNFAPTHAFSAFYRYLREDFAADAILHFGTHGALEFMPGKQAGLTQDCWPERLIGDVPNVYLYAANNPSEGTIAKRRSAATLVSYLTPTVTHAGLYKGLADLKSSLERWRQTDPSAVEDRNDLIRLIGDQACAVDLAEVGEIIEPDTLSNRVLELEYTLIPHGLHVVGGDMDRGEHLDLLSSIA